MTHEEKTKAFLAKTGREAFKSKTPWEDLPFKHGYGSTTHHPERKGGITTCDIKLWCKFLDGEWFNPYGHFTETQIRELYDVCINDNQVVALFELLSARKERVK